MGRRRTGDPGSPDPVGGSQREIDTDFQGNHDGSTVAASRTPSRIGIRLLVVACAAAVLPVRSAIAVPGDLDPTFGNDGRVVTDFTRANDGASDVAIQSNGKIVAVGRASTRRFYGRFALARYRPTGRLDRTFGEDGLVTTNFVEREDAASAVALQADGRIVVVGGAAQTARDSSFAVARYTRDGILDASFGDGGMLTTNFTMRDDSAADVAIHADGRIVVVGTAGRGKFAVARYDSDGTRDITFDGDGTVMTEVAPGYDSARAVAIDATGKIVVAGSAGDGTFAVVRYAPDGSLDATFDADGIVTTDLTGGFDAANSVAIDPPAKIVVAGEAAFCCEYTASFGLIRYQPDGALDVTFGGDGVVITDFTRYGDAASDLAIQANGKIVAAGSRKFNGTTSRFALARYKPSGRSDRTFGGDGKVSTAFSRGFDSARAVAIQADGQIVAVGSTYPDIEGLDGSFALARYRAGRSAPT